MCLFWFGVKWNDKMSEFPMEGRFHMLTISSTKLIQTVDSSVLLLLISSRFISKGKWRERLESRVSLPRQALPWLTSTRPKKCQVTWLMDLYRNRLPCIYSGQKVNFTGICTGSILSQESTSQPWQWSALWPQGNPFMLLASVSLIFPFSSKVFEISGWIVCVYTAVSTLLMLGCSCAQASVKLAN